MERLGYSPFDDPGTRFALDNIRDGIKDDSLLVWEAHDTLENKVVWILGRKIRSSLDPSRSDVFPCALLFCDSLKVVRRYAPAGPDGKWDYSQVEGAVKVQGGTYD
jgi:hypothetical protein